MIVQLGLLASTLSCRIKLSLRKTLVNIYKSVLPDENSAEVLSLDCDAAAPGASNGGCGAGAADDEALSSLCGDSSGGACVAPTMSAIVVTSACIDVDDAAAAPAAGVAVAAAVVLATVERGMAMAGGLALRCCGIISAAASASTREPDVDVIGCSVGGLSSGGGAVDACALATAAAVTDDVSDDVTGCVALLLTTEPGTDTTITCTALHQYFSHYRLPIDTVMYM